MTNSNKEEEIIAVCYLTSGDTLIRRITFLKPPKFAWGRANGEPTPCDRDEVIAELKWPVNTKDILRKIAPGMRHPTEYVECRKVIKIWKSTALKKSWEDVLPQKILDWAWEEIRWKVQEINDPCIDNYRCARMSSSSQMRRFKKQRADGCCGKYEWIAIGPDKERYLFGFNYGH